MKGNYKKIGQLVRFNYQGKVLEGKIYDKTPRTVTVKIMRNEYSTEYDLYGIGWNEILTKPN